MARGPRHLLGITIGGTREERHAIDLIADLEAINAGLEALDDTGNIPSQYKRWLAQHRESTGANIGLDRVDRGRLHANEDLGRERHRVWPFHQFQDVRITKYVLLHGTHINISCDMNMLYFG